MKGVKPDLEGSADLEAEEDGRVYKDLKETPDNLGLLVRRVKLALLVQKDLVDSPDNRVLRVLMARMELLDLQENAALL